MGVEDLTFTTIAGADLLDPVEPTVSADGYFGVTTFNTDTSLVQRVRITNNGTGGLADIGVYLKPATNLGPLTNQTYAQPIQGWQDALSQGQQSYNAVLSGSSLENVASGVLVQIDGGSIQYLRWGAGDTAINKIIVISSLAAGAYVDATIGWFLDNNGISNPDTIFVDLVFE